MPVLAAVSHATLESGSCARHASRTASAEPPRACAIETTMWTSLGDAAEYERYNHMRAARNDAPETWSQILSGWPSFTDSEVNRNVFVILKSVDPLLRGGEERTQGGEDVRTCPRSHRGRGEEAISQAAGRSALARKHQCGFRGPGRAKGWSCWQRIREHEGVWARCGDRKSNLLSEAKGGCRAKPPPRRRARERGRWRFRSCLRSPCKNN